MRISFIVWARYGYQSHTELFAQHLGATTHYVWHGRRGGLVQTGLRYSVQALKTWRTLRRLRPDVVFVQNPPIFCALVVSLYAQRHGIRYVIDSHSGAFLSPKWRWALGMHRLLSRGAITTIVHNSDLEEFVKRWRCRSMVIGFIPATYPAGTPFPLDGTFNVAVISSFLDDEPFPVLFEAATYLPEVTFYITGDHQRANSDLLTKAPENCRLTGYLPHDEYIGLLRGVDAIIVLTTQDHTVLMGGFEAVSLGKVLITSDWPVLKDYFHSGTVHVSNTVEAVCEGVRRAQREHTELQQGVTLLRKQLETEWQQKLTELQCLLNRG
jgi:glycosyltransferase involved in cell wall biosynthesis